MVYKGYIGLFSYWGVLAATSLLQSLNVELVLTIPRKNTIVSTLRPSLMLIQMAKQVGLEETTMISIDPDTQSERENYKLLIGSIVPRPIALVTTLSQQGVLNAAPFSYFSIVSSQPPLLSVSVQRKQGAMKDTARNAIEIGAFVIHITDESNIDKVNETAANLPPDESEVIRAGFTPITSESIVVPGLKEAKIRMECLLEQFIPLGGSSDQPACDLLIGRVVRFHIADDVYEHGHIDPENLGPISRMAGNSYAKLGPLFSMDRPK
jgi:flavin reductase (DIM6/NTAB) family NADH-FMN oxidoreductase RutF